MIRVCYPSWPFQGRLINQRVQVALRNVFPIPAYMDGATRFVSSKWFVTATTSAHIIGKKPQQRKDEKNGNPKKNSVRSCRVEE